MTPSEKLESAKSLLSRIVCTNGIDKGVVLLDHEGRTVWSEEHKCQMYTHEYFSPLGDALIELWELVGEEECKSETNE